MCLDGYKEHRDGRPRMTHQGFLASFSTSALLVGAALSILLVVSAVVAFEGWPGPTGDTPTDTFLLTDVREAGNIGQGPHVVLEPPAPAGVRQDQSGGVAEVAGASGTPSAGTALAPAAADEPVPTAASPGAGLEAPAAPVARPAPTVGAPAPTGALEGTVDGATGAIEGGTDALAPVTGPLEGVTEGPTESVTRSIGGGLLR
jgi:hypothetical protein